MSIGFKLPFILKNFKETDSLLSARLDFLMMTMLLLGFDNLKILYPAFVRLAMAVGSITNPTVF